MRLDKAERRDERKRNSRKMRVSGRSVFTIQAVQVKRARKNQVQ